MVEFEFGEVVLLPFIYSDLQSSKRRPALVLIDSGDEDVLLAKITTKRYATDYDVPVREWKNAGLFAPSFVRLHKLMAAEKDHVIQRLGKLNNSDATAIRKSFRAML
jgi:mRNA interferase MazF